MRQDPLESGGKLEGGNRMALKKIIIYPDNSLCIEGRMYSAPQGFFEKYGIPSTRSKSLRGRTKGADFIKRENVVFVCHYQPQQKGSHGGAVPRPSSFGGMLPSLPFLEKGG